MARWEDESNVGEERKKRAYETRKQWWDDVEEIMGDVDEEREQSRDGTCEPINIDSQQ